ncbi:hypothetical protein J4479_04025 [Candidatus Woesearchaeota archaeon]|nr:hypothetical protein [Candidatus Woesearchaeota archaeon]
MKKKQIAFPSKGEAQPWHAAPLKGSFMILAIVGFLVSAYLFTNPAWRLAFLIVFAAMFVASIISMTKADVVPEK